MASRRSDNSNTLADEIRRRLEQSESHAQSSEASNDPQDRMRVTKDGEIIPPGEDAPDGVPHTVVPDAVFHADAAAKRIVLCRRSVADAIRESCRTMHDEDGGVLFGVGPNGDVVAQARAPENARRSPSVIEIRGADIESAAREIVASVPGSYLVGWWHLHLGFPALSMGDLAMLDRLHEEGNAPANGILKFLAVKDGEVWLRAFFSPRAGVVEEAELFEVEDVVQARAALDGSVPAPKVAPHAFGSSLGARRFNDEVNALVHEGYDVTANVVAVGVQVIVRHPAHAGALTLTVPSEGWSRPPRIEHWLNGTTRLIAPSLQPLLVAWSSAFTLMDIVAQVRGAKGCWPKTKATRARTNGAKQSGTEASP